MQLYEGSRLRARRLKRKDNGEALYLKQADFTACSVCGDEPPLWQLSSRNFKHNAPQKEMRFIHSFLEVKDIPIFYLPYLNVPDFSVKRKSGLLSPSLSHGSEMGEGITLPFFIDVAENQNLIVRPTISTSHDPLAILEYDAIFDKTEITPCAPTERKGRI
jgi:LPS-assembly protein